jgi:hypothetical protein
MQQFPIALSATANSYCLTEKQLTQSKKKNAFFLVTDGVISRSSSKFQTLFSLPEISEQ